jgi:hypothetical protein
LAAPENAAVARDSSIPAIIDFGVVLIVVPPLRPSLGAHRISGRNGTPS